MLREYLIAEAMHALSVPTARALSVVATGEKIRRDGPVPGAVLTRVAASHIRVGTFEYAARLGDPTTLQRLADHSIARHYRAAAEADAPYLVLLEAVADAQASLVARWILVGFIHGVMNTDNMTISGETIDYGPCAFMDHYEPATVFSSIDHAGRYSYGNQPNIALWNLTRFAETLLPLINRDIDAASTAAMEVLSAFGDRYRLYWVDGMRAKLGLSEDTPGDETLFDDLLELLRTHRVDYTASFRALAALLRGDHAHWGSLFEDRVVLDEWTRRWRARLDTEGCDPLAVATAMDRSNPIYIPRNHLVEEALEAATNGAVAAFHELLQIVTHPFDEQEGRNRFSEPAPDSFNKTFQTYCGT